MSITLTKGGESLVLDTPRWGYEPTIHLPIYCRRLASGAWAHRDDGTAYDYRTCRATWLLPAATAESLLQWNRLYSKSRAETFTLALGGAATGFYPFGPDLGDSGSFTVRLLAVEQGGWQISPWGYVEVTVEMCMVTAPGGYSLPTEYAEGTLTIGTVTDLRWPEGGYRPVGTVAVQTAVTRGGVPYSLDLADNADSWETEFTLRMNQGKAAALAYYLVNTARATDVVITGPARHYPFGVELHNPSLTTMECDAVLVVGDDAGSALTLRHNEHESWEMTTRWWMKRLRDSSILVYQDIDAGGLNWQDIDVGGTAQYQNTDA